MRAAFCQDRILCIMTALLIVIAVVKEGNVAVSEDYRLHPIGHVVQHEQSCTIEIYPAFQDALLGLDGFSHIIVLYWFDRNDTPEKRSILRVHPRGDATNPLTGVFATRSPVRPNLIGHTICKIKALETGRIIVDRIDAFDRTPVIDIKPYIPDLDAIPDATVPAWSPNLRQKQ